MKYPFFTSRVSRRKFVDWLLGSSFVAFFAAWAYPVGRYMVPPESPESSLLSVTLPIKADDVGVNEAHSFKFGNRPGVLLRTAAGDLRAFSATCPHLGCTIQYHADEVEFICACHNGRFDGDGRNISGPPPEPLEAFAVHVQGDEIVVSKA